MGVWGIAQERFLPRSKSQKVLVASRGRIENRPQETTLTGVASMHHAPAMLTLGPELRGLIAPMTFHLATLAADSGICISRAMPLSDPWRAQAALSRATVSGFFQSGRWWGCPGGGSGGYLDRHFISAWAIARTARRRWAGSSAAKLRTNSSLCRYVSSLFSSLYRPQYVMRRSMDLRCPSVVWKRFRMVRNSTRTEGVITR